MILPKLVDEIGDIIQDTGYTATTIKALINEACLEIASGVRLPGKYELSPPLPTLFTSDTMVTVAGTDIAALPSDFNRNVTQILNSDSDPIKIKESPILLATKYPAQDAGVVFVCAIQGKRFIYRDIPASPETLTAYYYKTPTVLSEADDEPDFIPENFQKKLIVSYVCKEIFDRIEDGIEYKKTNTNHYTQKYYSALEDLELEIGVDYAPIHHDDTGVYYCP